MTCIRSPRLGQNIALAMVSADVAGIGTEREVVTATGPRRATLAERPFHDPRKTLTIA